MPTTFVLLTGMPLTRHEATAWAGVAVSAIGAMTRVAALSARIACLIM
ncbi:hypothetical protein ABZ318_38840 [Streptomyces sp. NPDC006197]